MTKKIYFFYGKLLSILLFALSVFCLTADASAQTLTFSGRQIQTGGQYQVTADFNGDGRADIATAGLDVEILLGNGDGTFKPNLKYPVGTSLTGITKGDFNGDARLDLAVTIASPKEIGILLGNGDGTFGQIARFPTNADGLPTSSVAADFNRDGKLDLMTSDPYNCASSCAIFRTVTVLPGNGDGTFQPPRQIEVGTPPSKLELGDFNRDGIVDVTAAAAFGKVLVLLGNGDGTFRQMPDVLIIQNVDNTDVVVADFNGDTIQDLVAAADAESKFGVSLGNGDGTFRPPTIITDPMQQRGWTLTPGDFNRDGRQDVGIGHGYCCVGGAGVPGAFGVMLGNGNGTFQTISRHIVPNNGRIQLATIDPVVADFNGDGKPDVAAMFYNNIGGTTRGTIILTNTSGVSPASLALGTMSVNPTSIGGGTKALVNIPLAAGAVASSNISLTVSNTNTSVAFLPFSTTSPPFMLVKGMTNLQFWIETRTVTTPQTVTITVRSSNLGSRSVTLTVTPPNTPLALGSLEVSAGVFGGNDAGGQVTLVTGHVAPVGGALVTLTNGNPNLISMPGSVVIPAGQSTAGFTIQTDTVGTTTPVDITASYGGVTKSAVLPVYAPSQAVPISSVTLAPSTVTGGSQTTQMTITLAANAPNEGATIMLSSSRPDIVPVPRSTRIFFSTQNSTVVNFAPFAVSVPTNATITARFGASSGSAVLTVNPAPAGGAVISSLTLNPASIAGGSTSQGTVALTSAASSPMTISLASSSAPIVTVPASVTIPAGATTANFTVNTTSVSSQFNATITASLNGASRLATLTVTPAGDTVAIQRAEYDSGNRTLRVEATSTRTNATMEVLVTSTGQIIGTLSNNGGGKYSRTLNWSVNPQNITVRSSFGGQASRAVTAK